MAGDGPAEWPQDGTSLDVGEFWRPGGVLELMCKGELRGGVDCNGPSSDREEGKRRSSDAFRANRGDGAVVSTTVVSGEE